MQAEQAAQRPQQVHRTRAVAQRGEGQPGAAEQRQPGEQQAAEAGALAPVLQGQVEAVAPRQQPGAGEDALAQVAAALAGLPAGFAVLQRPAAFLDEAQGFGEPEGFGDGCEGQAASAAAGWIQRRG